MITGKSKKEHCLAISFAGLRSAIFVVLLETMKSLRPASALWGMVLRRASSRGLSLLLLLWLAAREGSFARAASTSSPEDLAPRLFLHESLANAEVVGEVEVVTHAEKAKGRPEKTDITAVPHGHEIRVCFKQSTAVVFLLAVATLEDSKEEKMLLTLALPCQLLFIGRGKRGV